ncbi:MAG: prepilin-type N-terminal cleavage/methylation domain-containing protein [Candidatus Omnitrophota bacterium]
MKKGFTLLEIIVVLIILGIIATLGFLQYTRVIEKGRTAEAKTNLGTIRTMAMAYYEENGEYFSSTYIANTLGLENDASCVGVGTPATLFYYYYEIEPTTGDMRATRCTDGGKPPACKAPACPGGGYALILTPGGVGSSEPTGMW